MIKVENAKNIKSVAFWRIHIIQFKQFISRKTANIISATIGELIQVSLSNLVTKK